MSFNTDSVDSSSIARPEIAADLKHLLAKDPIIATYTAQEIKRDPATCEQTYRVYARTHIPLGETERYTDTIFKWVSGANQGAFIGAVVGANGQGKTSFQVHLWEEASKRKVLAVPPFSWDTVSDMVDGAAFWVQHMLRTSAPTYAREAEELRNRFRDKSLREIAEDTVRQNARGTVDEEAKRLEDMVRRGVTVEKQASPDELLEFLDKLSHIVQQAGYRGLLLLLDEPEIAARKIGQGQVAYILFQLANGLHNRQGNYGVLFSIPESFYQFLITSQPSLPARLQACKCFILLNDLYGATFAPNLWQRYVQEFQIPNNGEAVVTPEALTAIGQVGSSDRSDLGYGPRTVVSAFRRMVEWYTEKKEPYPALAVSQDCVDSEIMAAPEYATLVRRIFESSDATGIDRVVLQTLASFPDGIDVETLERAGIDRDAIRELSERRELVYNSRGRIGFQALRRVQVTQQEAADAPLRKLLQSIGSEFAPHPGTLDQAIATLRTRILPEIFAEQSGQQVIGWTSLRSVQWDSNPQRLKNTFCTVVQGTWPQTREFPRRKVAIVISPLEADVDGVMSFTLHPDRPVDLVLHLQLRWTKAVPMPVTRAEVDYGDVDTARPAVIRLVLDLWEPLLPQASLQEILSEDIMTPFGWLYLCEAMSKRTLPNQLKSIWDSIETTPLRELPGALLGSSLRSQVAELGFPTAGAAVELIPGIARPVLKRRLPKYSTLILAPRWESPVDDYIRALQNQAIPRSAKRGQEAWISPGDSVAKILSSNLMNLDSSPLKQLGDLIVWRSVGTGRARDIEVTFKLHPLERILMDLIQANPKGRKRFDSAGDKECPYVSLPDLLPMLVTSGYMPEEIAKIVEIGKARQTFCTHQGKSGGLQLYCPPLDLDQLKGNAQFKVGQYAKEVDAVAVFGDFKVTLDPASLNDESQNIQDEADYDRLLKRVGDASAHIRQYVDKRYNSVDIDGDAIEKKATASRLRLSTSPGIAALKNPISAVSPWVVDLTDYCGNNLRTTHQEVLAAYDEAIRDAKSILALDNSFKSEQNTLKQIELLVQGQSVLESAITKVQGAMQQDQSLTLQVGEYEHWRTRVASRSDDLRLRLVDMRNDPANRGTGEALYKELEGIWNDISVHLKTRNVSGLGSYEQFLKQIQELDQKQKDYQTQMKAQFDALKSQVNDTLTTLDVRGARCTTPYNSGDIDGCSSHLYEEAIGSIQKAVGQELEDIKEHSRELEYARDVLLSLPTDAATALLTRLDAIRADLELAERRDADWLRRAVEKDEDAVAECAALKEQFAVVRQAGHDARLLIRSGTPDPGRNDENKLSEQAQALLAFLPERPGESIDLKQIVLKRLASGSTAGTVLDETLQSLGELFRHNALQVKVERPRR